MQYTPNFNFNLPEGTDLWNYLTQTNPNFSALDTLLKGIQDGTVTTATEVTSGTAHAVTRTLPDANVIRFTATGVWTLGDTMTIDGTPVTVVKPNGTSLQTGDYIIGSEVLGVLRATQFTVYVGGASSIDAEDVDYDNTVSGLTATDVQAAIDEEAAAIDTINSNLVQNSWDTQISIDPTIYNSYANAYEFSTHGVLFCIANNVAGAYLDAMISNNDGSSSRELAVANAVVGKYQSAYIPVFKGMKVYFTNSNNGGILVFMPYTN